MEQELASTAITPPVSPDPDGILPMSLDLKTFGFSYEQTRPVLFPELGEVIENCRLVVKLGTGASGQAILAQQVGLADRPVVLKLTAADSRDEHMKLARLQHTHIMPLYWVATLPDRGLRVLAMPYLGRTTLAGLLLGLKEFPIAAWTGERVFAVLQADQASVPIQIAVQAQPAAVLKQSSWVQFVARLGQTLAEALAYAHERELLHLDIKPANILVTPDGQPILLDLDVARKPISAGVTLASWLGGTLSFTSPEQYAAIKARSRQQPTPYAVDGRSDLYSLGLVLFQALGGQRISQSPPDARTLPRLNPGVSQGLAEIVARCLAHDPADRYPDGNALAEDLRRHLHDLPLVSVHNTLAERWRKWRRRRPLALAILFLLVAFFTTVITAGVNSVQLNDERQRQAETALAEGLELQRRGQHEAAIHRFLAGQEPAKQAYGAGVIGAQIARRLRMAQRLQKADELHTVVHLMRFYALQEHTPRRMQHVLEAAGRKLWGARGLLTDQSDGRLELAAEKNINTQLQELAVLWSEQRVRLAPPEQVEQTRDEARTVLIEAEHIFGSSQGLSLAREQLGDAPRPGIRPEAAWEFCTLGRKALAEGRYDDAARFMQQAIDKEPLGFVPHFYFGVSALRQKKYEDALQAFSFCVGQDPRAECFLLRGQAHAALGANERALTDFGHTIQKSPSFAIAYHLRGSLLHKMGRQIEATSDDELARNLDN